jgi:hypothetical protein
MSQELFRIHEDSYKQLQVGLGWYQPLASDSATSPRLSLVDH